MKQSGNIFYIDEYDQQYITEWSTTNGVIHIISTVKMPQIWGEADSGYIQNGIVYRKGLITVTRQLLRITSDGYDVVAEGIDQYHDYFRTNFNCVEGPSDIFKFHINNSIVDGCSGIAETGPRFADPDVAIDSDAIWGDIDSDGLPLTTSVDGEIFGFIDVWI